MKIVYLCTLCVVCVSGVRRFQEARAAAALTAADSDATRSLAAGTESPALSTDAQVAVPECSHHPVAAEPDSSAETEPVPELTSDDDAVDDEVGAVDTTSIWSCDEEEPETVWAETESWSKSKCSESDSCFDETLSALDCSLFSRSDQDDVRLWYDGVGID